jgi:DNA-binding LytR/AlgR family response regulator
MRNPGLVPGLFFSNQIAVNRLYVQKIYYDIYLNSKLFMSVLGAEDTVLSRDLLIRLLRKLDENIKIDKNVNPPPKYKERFLVRFGDHLQPKPVEDIAYFYAEDKTTYLIQQSTQRRYVLEYKMRTLETTLLPPKRFFRINRTFIVNIDAILDVRAYTNGRLKVILNIPCDMELIVSRNKVHSFKKWLDM